MGIHWCLFSQAALQVVQVWASAKTIENGSRNIWLIAAKKLREMGEETYVD